jgi:hypothetical protein
MKKKRKIKPKNLTTQYKEQGARRRNDVIFHFIDINVIPEAETSIEKHDNNDEL